MAIGDYLSEEGFTTLNLNLKDDSTQSLTEAFQKFFPVVQRAKESNQKCLILCHSGMSRSVSLVIAYLLTCERMSLIEAFAHVKERRKIASPNPGFMAQLIQLERETRSSVTVDLERYKNDRFGDPFSFAVELRNNNNNNNNSGCNTAAAGGGGGVSGTTYHITTSDDESPREEEGITSIEKKKIRKRYDFASSSSSASSYSSSPTISITPIFLQQKRYPPPRQQPGSSSSSQATSGDKRGEDIFVTFTFSFDEAKPRCKTKGHSDMSVQFWEEVKQHNNMNTAPSGPYHSHSSDNSTSAPSPLHHSRSESSDFSTAQLPTDPPSCLQQNDVNLPSSPSTAEAPNAIVSSSSKASLHQLMPMLQGVSSYVTSFLKCNNTEPVFEAPEDIFGEDTNNSTIVSNSVALLDVDIDTC